MKSRAETYNFGRHCSLLAIVYISHDLRYGATLKSQSMLEGLLYVVPMLREWSACQRRKDVLSSTVNGMKTPSDLEDI